MIGSWLKDRRRRRFLAAMALAACVLWLGSSALVAWRLTRRAGRPYAEPLPELSGVTVEACRLPTTDGQELGAWLVRGDRHQACVLLLHGNGDSRRQMLPVMRGLAQSHFTALAITLRAHGDSTGEVNDLGWSARHDVAAGVQFLQRGFPGQPVYIVGRSLGAAAAIFAARELGQSVAGYFLEQPYKDLDSATWNRLQHYLPSPLDYAAYLGLRLWGPVFLSVDARRISPCQHIAEIPQAVPVVLLVGTADRHSRPGDVAEVYGRVQSHARLVMFEGAAHESLLAKNPELYWSSLFELLGQRAGKASLPRAPAR